MADPTAFTSQPGEHRVRHLWWCRLVPIKSVHITSHESVRGTYVKARCLVCQTATEVVPPGGVVSRA